MTAHRYRIHVAYDGTDYAGWQVQPSGITVQARLEEALGRICGETVKVHGSGRTDQGVHARRQVAHFDLSREWAAPSLLKALNGVLPADIRVLRAGKATPAFHARRDARAKEYRYFIWNAREVPPMERRDHAHVRNRLDVAAMREAAAALVGRHDFSAFTANPNREIESAVRELYALRVMKRGSEIVIVARGEGFLYKMVRSLAGFLIRVGEGALPPSAAKTILHSRTRTAAVPTAPPQGLFLWDVWY